MMHVHHTIIIIHPPSIDRKKYTQIQVTTSSLSMRPQEEGSTS